MSADREPGLRERAGFRAYLIVVLLGFTMFSNYAVRTVVPYIAERLGISAAWLSRVLYVSFVVLALMAPVAGYLCDRYGYRGIVTAASAACLALTPLYHYVRSIRQLLALRIAHAAATEVLIASSMGLAAAVSARGGSGFGVLRFGQGLGIALGPLAAGILMTRADVYALAAACVPLALLLVAIMVVDVGDERRGHGFSWPDLRAGLACLADAEIASLFLPAVGEAVSFTILLSYYTAYLVKVLGTPSTVYGAFLALEAVGFSLGSLVSEKLFGIFGFRALIAASSAMAMSYAYLFKVSRPLWTLPAAFAIGLTGGCLLNPAYGELSRRTPSGVRATVVNVFDLLVDVCMAAAVLLLDPLVAWLGLRYSSLIASLVVSISLVMAAALRARSPLLHGRGKQNRGVLDAQASRAPGGARRALRSSRRRSASCSRGPSGGPRR